MSLQQILQEHQNRYPLMEMQDYHKLIYQYTFGPAHFINTQKSYDCLKREIQMITHDTHEKFIDISPQLTRYHLGKEDIYHLELIHNMVHASANHTYGTLADYQENLSILQEFFNTHNILVHIKQPSKTPPPFPHSILYKQEYDPHYRLVHMYFKTNFTLLKTIHDYLKIHSHGIIIIDGKCASGKTTLAHALKSLWNASLIHMDDFFLQPHMRSEERLREIGGNFDYERFEKEIVQKLMQHQSFTYVPYLCQQNKFSDPIKISAQNPIIIEGAYALHPKLDYPQHLSIFLDIEQTTQQQRISKRNPDLIQRFTQEWIPKENAYFKKFHIQEKAHITWRSKS